LNQKQSEIAIALNIALKIKSQRNFFSTNLIAVAKEICNVFLLGLKNRKYFIKF
jgi:hypothetical protein